LKASPSAGGGEEGAGAVAALADDEAPAEQAPAEPRANAVDLMERGRVEAARMAPRPVVAAAEAVAASQFHPKTSRKSRQVGRPATSPCG
jgi:hypothetical protein